MRRIRGNVEFMVWSATHNTSLEQFLALPDDGQRRELVHGWTVGEPRPGPRQGRVAATLKSLLYAYAEKRTDLGTFTCNAAFLLHRSPDTVRGPDLAFLSRERHEATNESAAVVTAPPDLAIEVLSPASRRSEVHAKVADYLAAGTRVVWVVDPAREVIVSYRHLLSPQLLSADDLLQADDLLPGFTVPVVRVFRPR